MFCGFFTTMTEVFPPNLGMHDQVAALEWIKREIRNFGGNSNRVTIAGQNAGAVSVSLHSYSPRSEDLYHQAIIQSGTALNPFGLKGNRFKIQTSKAMAVGLGCISEYDWEQKKFGEVFQTCIKEAPPGKIWNTYLHVMGQSKNSDNLFQGAWAPVVDGKNGFLPTHPTMILSRNLTGKKFLMGVTRDEKANLVLPQLLNGKASIEDFSERKMDWLLSLLARQEAFPGKFRVVSDFLRFAYTKTTFKPLGKNDHLGWINAMVEAASDYWMNAGVAEESRSLQVSNASVYLYSFDYVSEAALEMSSYYKGIAHGTDLLFLFPHSAANNSLERVELEPWNFTAEDNQMSELMLNMWTNFVKTGDPNKPVRIPAQWRPLNQGTDHESLHYLSLSLKPHLHRTFHPMGDYFWNQVIPPFLSLPYNEERTRGALDSFLSKRQNNFDDQDNDEIASWKTKNPYYVATWVLVGVCVVVILTSIFVALIYRQKLHSYNLLRRVEQLNFYDMVNT